MENFALVGTFPIREDGVGLWMTSIRELVFLLKARAEKNNRLWSLLINGYTAPVTLLSGIISNVTN